MSHMDLSTMLYLEACLTTILKPWLGTLRPLPLIFVTESFEKAPLCYHK